MRSAERGSATLELVIVIPATLLLISLVIMGGRLALAHQAIQAVAYDAARAASVARNAGEATSTANHVAAFSLASNGLSCLSTSTNVNTAGFAAAVGQNATVTADVSCTVRLGDLSLPGVPGSVTLTAEATSPIDTYRER
ncbi:pilus assembly protein [Tessaracoccus lubricantis]|uniref:Pilus assembly protein n=1 Tax=Tessaracoccus lubricantis TaxID=545543 RepID=A0ABP9FNQ0_9ACTN